MKSFLTKYETTPCFHRSSKIYDTVSQQLNMSQRKRCLRHRNLKLSSKKPFIQYHSHACSAICFKTSSRVLGLADCWNSCYLFAWTAQKPRNRLCKGPKLNQKVHRTPSSRLELPKRIPACPSRATAVQQMGPPSPHSLLLTPKLPCIILHQSPRLLRWAELHLRAGHSFPHKDTIGRQRLQPHGRRGRAGASSTEANEAGEAAKLPLLPETTSKLQTKTSARGVPRWHVCATGTCSTEAHLIVTSVVVA